MSFETYYYITTLLFQALKAYLKKITFLAVNISMYSGRKVQHLSYINNDLLQKYMISTYKQGIVLIF